MTAPKEVKVRDAEDAIVRFIRTRQEARAPAPDLDEIYAEVMLKMQYKGVIIATAMTTLHIDGDIKTVERSDGRTGYKVYECNAGDGCCTCGRRFTCGGSDRECLGSYDGVTE